VWGYKETSITVNIVIGCPGATPFHLIDYRSSYLNELLPIILLCDSFHYIGDTAIEIDRYPFTINPLSCGPASTTLKY
jgi:hypothetical protein